MGVTDGQKKAITIWAIITGLIWVSYLVVRLLTGGNCERPELVKDFDRTKYLGRWYEMYREKSVPFESEDCATATYLDLGSNYIDVNNVEYSLSQSKFKNGEVPADAKAQCSFFRSGLC